MDDTTVKKTQPTLLRNVQTSKGDEMWSYGKIMHRAHNINTTEKVPGPVKVLWMI